MLQSFQSFLFLLIHMPQTKKEFIQNNECEKKYDEGKNFHHPTKNSGVTIGAGTDLRDKTPEFIEQMFKDRITAHELSKIKEACGKKGADADNFCKDNKDFVLSKQSYQRMLEAEIKYHEEDVQRIMTTSVVKHWKNHGYDQNTYQQLPQEFKDVLLDMRYNGRFVNPAKAILIPKMISLVSAKRANDNNKFDVLYDDICESLVKIYNSPPSGLRKDENRAKKVGNYLKNYPHSQANHSNGSFHDKMQRMVKDIQGNNNNIGGVDFGFDLKKTHFSGFHCSRRGFCLKQSSEEQGLTLADLVVPLKVLIDQNIKAKNISVSLDPEIPTQPDGPLFKKVYYPQQLQGTQFGDAMIEADYLMKQLNLGRNQKNQPFKYPKSLVDIGMDFQTLITKYPKTDTQIERTRLWIVIEDLEIDEKQNGEVILKDIVMGLKAIAQQISSEGSLKDSKQLQISKHNQEFIGLFTKHYNILEKEYPIFKTIRRYAKAATLARLLMEKGCPINEDLIEKLYKEQVHESQKTVKRLQNKFQNTSPSNQTLIRRISGGCDLVIHKEEISNKKIPLQEMDMNQQYLSENFKPFIFQLMVKCKEQNCNRDCNMDYYSVKNKQCFKHSTMKCTMCLQLIYIGQKYQSLGGNKYHLQCTFCFGCESLLNPEQFKENKVAVKEECFYHQKCYPVGYCDFCHDVIKHSSDYGSVNDEIVHKKCFTQWQMAQMASIKSKAPKCDKCNEPIIGAYKSNGTQSWHPQCFQQPKCSICNQGNKVANIGEMKAHLGCLKCQKCKQRLDTENKFGTIGQGKFIHVKCVNL